MQGLVVGDINDDGWPDAFIGTGTPAWSEHDLLWLNAGEIPSDATGSAPAVWRGFTKHILGSDDPGGAPQTRGHGAAFGDLDLNWHTDLLVNPGGFALTDTMLARMWKKPNNYKCDEFGGVRGQCDSREMPSVYFRTGSAPHAVDESVRAAVRLEGRHSNRDAVGAHIQMLSPTRDAESDGTRATATKTAGGHHWWVHSTNGFQSQNSRWIMLPMQSAERCELRVTWPRGHVSEHVIKAWTREVLIEPEAAGPPSTRSGDPGGLRARTPDAHVADLALARENEILKERLASAGVKQDL
jgi:hypothetical protein